MKVNVFVPNQTSVYEYIVDAQVPDIYPPSINSLEDITLNEGFTSESIAWSSIDTNPVEYAIYKDGIEVGDWTNES